MRAIGPRVIGKMSHLLPTTHVPKLDKSRNAENEENKKRMKRYAHSGCGYLRHGGDPPSKIGHTKNRRHMCVNQLRSTTRSGVKLQQPSVYT